MVWVGWVVLLVSCSGGFRVASLGWLLLVLGLSGLEVYCVVGIIYLSGVFLGVCVVFACLV